MENTREMANELETRTGIFLVEIAGRRFQLEFFLSLKTIDAQLKKTDKLDFHFKFSCYLNLTRVTSSSVDISERKWFN